MTTISTQISFPVGVRALFGRPAQKRRELERLCVDAIEARGFDEVILPLVDFVDPYAAVISDRAQRYSYRFTDREGALVAIRSDFTPMVARVVAPYLSATTEPARIFYRGDVIRYEASRLGQNREFFQIGAEIIGSAEVSSEIEIILLAAEAMQRCGARPIVAYRDASLLSALVDGGLFLPAERQRLAAVIASKRPGALLDLRPRFDAEAFALLTKIVDGSIGIDDLERNDRTAEIGARLRMVSRAISAAGITIIPILDELPDSSTYYTGIQFDLYTDLGKTPVARGGRYDALYANFGADRPAVGFTLSVDLLEERS